ncbi:MAG: zinc ABC transporter substrate-binding protein, partial [Candidatus Altiarchaeales archaeon HGW-Altiarchaeales-3]
MKKVIIFLIFVLILSLSIIILSGCIENPQKEDNRLGIVVTILPQSEFAEKIGGDKVIVTVMVPPGASPHTYEPTPSQLMVVSNAKMYAKVGSGIEFERVWFDKIRETNKD